MCCFKSPFYPHLVYVKHTDYAVAKKYWVIQLKQGGGRQKALFLDTSVQQECVHDMLLPKVGYVQAFTIASLLICGVSLISLCIWRPGLLRRTFFGRRSKQNRFRKPKRRVDNADYNKLQQNVPEEEALESEAEELVCKIHFFSTLLS